MSWTILYRAFFFNTYSCQRNFSISKFWRCWEQNSFLREWKLFLASYLFEQLTVSIYSFWKKSQSIWERMGLSSKHCGVETVLMLPLLAEAENPEESGNRLDMYWLRAETAHDSLSKVEVLYHRVALGNELLPPGFLPREGDCIGIQHF